MLLITAHPTGLIWEMWAYFFGLPAFQEYIRSIAVGATMPSLNTRILSEVPILYPSLAEQRAIAHVLGTLDDKIELNRRMNETLEGMAQALFKLWFVDFEPVRAKMEGRWCRGESLPGMPAELYDLFPGAVGGVGGGGGAGGVGGWGPGQHGRTSQRRNAPHISCFLLERRYSLVYRQGRTQPKRRFRAGHRTVHSPSRDRQ